MHKGKALKRDPRSGPEAFVLGEGSDFAPRGRGRLAKIAPFRFVDFLGTRMGSRFLFSAGNKGS
jgi:hypothetical protein